VKEINIIKAVVAEALGDRENQTLKSFLGSEDSYLKFLDKFLRILIEQDKTITLRQFLDLHNISIELSNFLYRKEEIIWEIAELSAAGYTSEIIQWLQQSKNETYLNHLNFLSETKAGIKISERDALKKRLSNIDKINAFELSETEIKAGIKIVERKRLKKRFDELEKLSGSNTNASKPFKLKYSTLFLLIIASTFVLAVSIPSIRNFIKHEFNKIFKPEQPTEPSNSTTPKENKPTIKLDTVKPNTIAQDTALKIADSTNTLPKTKRLFLGKSKSKTIGTYKSYFIKYKNDLEPTEGIWTIKEKNSANYSCAIFKVADNKYELRYFNQSGAWERADHTYYFKVQVKSKNYLYSEYLEKKLIGSGVLKFHSPTSFKCEYDYNQEFLKKMGVKEGKKAHFILTAHKSENDDF